MTNFGDDLKRLANTRVPPPPPLPIPVQAPASPPPRFAPVAPVAPEPAPQQASASPRIPTILEFADLAFKQSKGEIKPLTPVWRAVLSAFYGLPLTEEQIDILVRVTSSRGRPAKRTETPPELPVLRQRSRAYWERRKNGGKPFSELVARVGRRGRKSWTTGLMVVYEAVLNKAHTMAPKGQTLAIPILSTQLSTTTGLTDPIRLYAKALGMDPKDKKQKGNRDSIIIPGIPYTIVILPCQRAALVSWSCPFIALDEFAHLNDQDSIESDVEIIRAIGPTQLQFRDRAKMFIVSSPMGNTGEFADRCEANLGDDSGSVAAGYRREESVLAVSGPSWEFGADDEADAQAVYDFACDKEPDEEAFWREYGGVPSGTAGVAFGAERVERAFKSRNGIWQWGRPFMCIDSAEGGSSSNNTWACVIGRCGLPTDELVPKRIVLPDGTSILCRNTDGELEYEEGRADTEVIKIEAVFGWTGPEIRELGTDVVLELIAQQALGFGCDYIFGDQAGAAYIEPILRKKHVAFRYFAHTNKSKREAVLTLRWLMDEHRLILPPHERLKTDLKTYPERIKGGAYSYGREIKKGHHQDFASAVMTMAHAMNNISLGVAAHGGVIGADQRGLEYTIQYAPLRMGVGKSEIYLPNNFVPEPEQAFTKHIAPKLRPYGG